MYKYVLKHISRKRNRMKYTETLKKNYEFKNVLSKGKYYYGNCITAYILKNRTEKQYIGFAISVKVGKAVVRNKIKRLLRECYKNIESNVTIGYSIVFLWKKNTNIENATFDNLNKDMINIFEKAGILKKI